uniref:C-type lectin domain-containing protein n=1 Tax=Strongyloides stercoralis TaxID=6248 RepID=A0A0K0ESI7_STRER
MFKPVTLLIAIVGFVSTQSQIDNYCNQIQFLHCSNQFANTLGLSPDLVFKNATDFRIQLATIFYLGKNNVNNWVNLCNSFNTFYQCLGQLNYVECLSPVGLIVNGATPNDAFDYDGTFRQYNFECSIGFVPYNDNYNCLASTWANAASQLISLSSSYRKNVNHDPKNACKYAKDLQDGYGQVFGSLNCKTNKKWATWWGCSIANEYVSAQFHHCNHVNKCVFDQILTSNSMVKFDGNGKLMVKIPKTWEKNEITGEYYQEEEKWL